MFLGRLHSENKINVEGGLAVKLQRMFEDRCMQETYWLPHLSKQRKVPWVGAKESAKVSQSVLEQSKGTVSHSLDKLENWG